MPVVKPRILSWARETAGLSVEEAAHRLGIKEARGVAGADRLRAFEAQEAVVSRPTLLKMIKVYPTSAHRWEQAAATSSRCSARSDSPPAGVADKR